VERAVVMGQSFGAALAMELALLAPERVIAVLAVSPIAFAELRLETLIYGPRAIPWLGEAIGYGPGRLLDAALLPVLWHAMFAPQAMPARLAMHYPFVEASGATQMLCLGEEAVQALPDLAAAATRYRECRPPLSILAGLADWGAPPLAYAVRLALAVPHAQIQLLPGLGHMLHHFAIAAVVDAVESLLVTPCFGELPASVS
jgi:pimeloyl-ACP methyl ester carboxylesterase